MPGGFPEEVARGQEGRHWYALANTSQHHADTDTLPNANANGNANADRGSVDARVRLAKPGRLAVLARLGIPRSLVLAWRSGVSRAAPR